MFNIKKIKFKKIIYPISTGVMIVTAVFFFIYSVRFLSASFNKAFSVNNELLESKMTKVDLETFESVKKKIGDQVAVPVSQIHDALAVSASSPEALDTPIQSEEQVSASSSEPVKIELDKTSIRIMVLNGSGKNGRAAELKEILVKDGFISTEIGNAPKITSETIIKIKPEKKDFTDILNESVGKKYEPVMIEDLDKENKYDIIITIGLDK
ncbi:MAG: LytR C-terminal domain-containing protein [bacterium]|nr:LytR C-terminal domain-containing protein [bacterium]